MPKVTEAHLETRRQQVLDAAFACFAQQGFHQTSIHDICQEAGLSPGAVYRYFSSKEQIIEACCEVCEQANLNVIDAAARTDDTLQILDELAQGAFGELEDSDVYPALCLNIQWWSEALRNAQLRDSLRSSGIDLWKGALAQIISRAQEKREINPTLDPDAVARVLLSAWQGLVLQKALDPSVDVGRYVEAVKAMYSGSFWQGDEETS